MKLAAVLKTIAPFLAADKKIEDVEAACLAADASMPGNVASSKEIEDKRGKDRKARDEKCAADRAARDKAAMDKRAADRKARDEKRAADRAARDAKMVKDRDDDPEHTNDRDDDPERTNDAEMKKEAEDESREESEAEDEDYMQGADPSTPGGNRANGKTAVDSAEVDRRIQEAVQARDALHDARSEVEPILGVVPKTIAYDSAEKVYRAALVKLGVDVAGVHDSALPSMLKLAKDRAAAPTLATDSAGATTLAKLIPNYDRLK